MAIPINSVSLISYHKKNINKARGRVTKTKNQMFIDFERGATVEDDQDIADYFRKNYDTEQKLIYNLVFIIMMV